MNVEKERLLAEKIAEVEALKRQILEEAEGSNGTQLLDEERPKNVWSKVLVGAFF